MGKEDEDFQDSKKPHRERHSGRKADKKKLKKEHNEDLSAKQKNPKAFTFNSVIRGERRFRRTQDLQIKKEHIPVVDRTTLEPPPILVAIVGPPKVGKTTLIHSLIKSYTRKPLTTIKGPVTVVSGKKRRITLFECNNDINSMVDVAKVADLVLLLIDGSYGFEMDIFEFLNICQVHGMPKVMGVLTHLDLIKRAKKLQKIKKILKRRFWTEVYAGAKLFYLSGILHGEYLKNEVKNLARFISVMKFRPLTWQTTHSYVLADRMEDLTSPEQLQVNSQCERTVSLYGYMRGIPMNKNSYIHIPGCGDFLLGDVSFLPDPCPLPEQLKKRSLIEKERLVYAPFSGVGGIVYDKDAVYIEVRKNQSNKKNEPSQELINSLFDTKETIDSKLAKSSLKLFSDSNPITSIDFEQIESKNSASRDSSGSPHAESNNDNEDLSNNGEVNSNNKRKKPLDSDSDFSDDSDVSDTDKGDKELYLSSNVDNLNNQGETPGLKGVQTETDKLIREKISNALAFLDAGKKDLSIDNWSECSSSDSEDLNEDEIGVKKAVPWDNENLNDDSNSDISGDDEEDVNDSDSEVENTDLNWKENLAQKAAASFIERQSSNVNLWKLVYGEQPDEPEKDENSDEHDEVGGLFKVVREKHESIVRTKELCDAFDTSKFTLPHKRDWNLPEVKNTIKDCFVTGKWKQEEDASELLKLDDMGDSDEELYGDFEDLETGEKFEGKSLDGDKPKETSKLSKEQLLEKKKKLKEKFDSEYDTKDEISYFDELKSEANKQAELNRGQFEGVDDNIRVNLEGFRAGMYVRIEINNVPWQMVENFNASYPLIVGGLQPGEQNVGFVKVQIKKHRWYPKILKTRDPLIISMGWRRFQTITVFSKQEDNMRHRMLKYTPEHVSCMAHFWGPITRAGTGFIALQSAASRKVDIGFRIAATGSVVDTNQSTVVTKKLKLIGTPYKIYKKTAFIQGMFNSALEVAKFETAKIKTVSGIRGEIKKSVNSPEGAFRAKFEDKILLSDIVFCRTWYRVEVPKFYIPVSTLLLPRDQKDSWIGMKTLGQLKRERGLRNEAQPDSMYTEIKREPRVSLPLVIPRALEKELPYEFKTKPPRNRNLTNSNDKPSSVGSYYSKILKKIVVRNEYESKVASLIEKLRTNFEDKQEKLKAATHKRMLELRKQKKAELARKYQKQKEMKKEIFRALSKYNAKEKNHKHKKNSR